MCLFCSCGGSHVETKSPRGIIKSESLQSEAWGDAALGRTWHLTLQFLVEDSRRRWWNVCRAASQDEQTDGWRKRTCQTWSNLLFRWRLPGTNSCELFVTFGRKAWLQQEGQNGWESVSDRHHGFGKEPHFSGTALMPCLCCHLTDICFIIYLHKKMEHRKDKWRTATCRCSYFRMKELGHYLLLCS